MKLFLFSASVFYLLGLKLTTHIEVKSPFIHKPATIESKAVPETKREAQALGSKPELIKKETTISTETKSGQLTAPCLKKSGK